MISAYLDARSDVEDAVARLAILEVGRRDLAEHGAPDGLLPAIDAAAEQGHTGGDALGVLASSVGVLRVSLPDPPATMWRSWRCCRWASPCSREPATVHRSRHRRHRPHRRGHRAGPRPAQLGGREVEGETLQITRTAPGGWSQRRFQQRAENVWENNAHLVADAVANAAEEIDARIVVVGGDVRAKGFLLVHRRREHATQPHDLTPLEPPLERAGH